MSTVNARVSIALALSLTASPDLGSSRVEQDVGSVLDVTHGTANGKADLSWVDERTLASNSSETLDLRALTNALGEAVAFAEISDIVIEADDGNTTVLSFGNAASEAWVAPWGGATAVMPMAAKGRVGFHSDGGYAAVNDTSDKLKVANASGAAATYRIGILGRSA